MSKKVLSLAPGSFVFKFYTFKTLEVTISIPWVEREKPMSDSIQFYIVSFESCLCHLLYKILKILSPQTGVLDGECSWPCSWPCC